MQKMLHSSDDDAATTLWKRYGAEDYATRFPSYGMTDMKFTAEHPRTWGWILTTANDLDRLMNYVLTKLPGIPPRLHHPRDAHRRPQPAVGRVGSRPCRVTR
jgi:hypothetical protein